MSEKKVAIVLRKMTPGTDWVISSVTEVPANIKLQYRSPETFAEDQMRNEAIRGRKLFPEFDKQEWKYVVTELQQATQFS